MLLAMAIKKIENLERELATVKQGSGDSETAVRQSSNAPMPSPSAPESNGAGKVDTPEHSSEKDNADAADGKKSPSSEEDDLIVTPDGKKVS